jgi:hypothetical protein
LTQASVSGTQGFEQDIRHRGNAARKQVEFEASRGKVNNLLSGWWLFGD